MKHGRWIFGTGLALSTLLAGCAGLSIQPVAVRPIEAAQAAKLAAQSETFVLDVSDEDDYAAAHLPRAVSVPYRNIWSRMYDLPWDKNAAILVYDSGSGRALAAAYLLTDEGYNAVYVLSGGLASWKQAGLPVASGPEGSVSRL